MVSRVERVGGEDIYTVGSVVWGMGQNAGYKKGLEFLQETNKSFQEFTTVFWFCRDVVIAIVNPGNEQRDVVKSGRDIVKKGLLTQEELDHIYEKCEFDEEHYLAPEFMRRIR